jgi:mono/diheme cytochrome c family protein
MNTQLRIHWLALGACLVCSAAALFAAGQAAPAADNKSHQGSPVAASSDGEKVFIANCARCHTPPMTLRPSATGTVVAHMRVRARLTRKDEQLLLKYLAP